jgi:hypothetical protein
MADTKDTRDAKDTVVDGAYALGIEMLDRGEPPAAVERKLIEMGCTADAANRIVGSYSNATAQAASSDGKLEMQFGGVALALGVLDLIYSGGGSVIAWFVTLGGAFNVYRGWSKRRAS